MGNALRLAIVKVGLCINRWDKQDLKTSKKNISIILVGLDQAGKSTISARLTAKDNKFIPDGTYTQTKGFSTAVIRKGRNLTIHIHDLGGSESIQELWYHYYADCHGLIFVVDSAVEDPQTWQRCQMTLEKVLSDERIKRKPILILANKQDLPGAITEMEVSRRLNLYKLVNAARCMTRIDVCSALGPKKGEAKGIFKGFDWLNTYIKKNYKEINERVEQDYEEERVREKTTRSRILAAKSKTEEIAVGSSTEDLTLKNVPENYNFSGKPSSASEGKRLSPEGADFNSNNEAKPNPKPFEDDSEDEDDNCGVSPKLDRGKSRMRLRDSTRSERSVSSAETDGPPEEIKIVTTKAQIHRSHKPTRDDLRNANADNELLHDVKVVYSKAAAFGLSQNEDSQEDLLEAVSSSKRKSGGFLRRKNKTAPINEDPDESDSSFRRKLDDAINTNSTIE